MFIDEENGIEIKDFNLVLKRKKIALAMIILSTIIILAMKLLFFTSLSWLYLFLPVVISILVFLSSILFFWLIMRYCTNF